MGNARDEILRLSQSDYCGIWERLGFIPNSRRGTGDGWTCPNNHKPGHRCASLYADVDRTSITCHDCKISGDVFKWAGELWGTDFKDTLSRLCDALGIQDEPENNNKPPKLEIEKVYDYRAADGSDLFQVVRFKPKTFRQRHADPAEPSGWKWGLTRADGTEIKPVLYGLEKLNEAPEGSLVFVVEGEKDVETAWAQGFRATCNPMGAGKAENVDWGPLAKMQVIIIADKDKDEDENHKKGRHHARDVKRLAIEAGAEVLGIIECPKGAKDLTDHIEAGGDMDELVRMVITARKGNDISLEHIYSRAGIGLGPTGLPADRIPTGFEKFDRLTLGIGRTWYISLLALQGVGKSTLAYQWALFAARNGYRVLIISTEMSPEETKETIAVQISGISRDRIAYGLVEAEAESFKAAEKEIAGLPILFDTIDPTAANPSETLTKKIRDCDICIVDHLTYLGLSLENAGRTDWKSILAVTKILVRIAESKRIPIIGIGHLNRQAEAARARGEAQGAEHTAGAFLIHAEAKLSLILENPRGAANREYRYLRIIKSRFSAGTGQALRLHFDGEHAKFTEEDFGEPVIEKPRWEPREKDDFQ